MKKLVLLLMMGLVLIIGCSKNKEAENGNKSDTSKEVSTENEIPAFTLTDLDGKTFDSKKLMENGKKTLFVVAAEWCPHCKTEMPHIQQFYDENKDKVNVVVVFTNANSSLEATKKYISENGYTVPAYYDADATVLNGLKVKGFPFNLKVNGAKIEKTMDPPVDYQKLVSEFTE